MIDVQAWMRRHGTRPAYFCAVSTWGWALPPYQAPGERLPADVYHVLQHGRAAALVPGTLEAGTTYPRDHPVCGRLLTSRQWATREAAVAALAAALDELAAG